MSDINLAVKRSIKQPTKIKAKDIRMKGYSEQKTQKPEDGRIISLKY